MAAEGLLPNKANFLSLTPEQIDELLKQASEVYHVSMSS